MRIRIGPKDPSPAAQPCADTTAKSRDWPVIAGAPNISEFVTAADFLLAAVGTGLGGRDHDGPLLDGLASVLALEGRESALPAQGLLGGDDLRGVLARQAATIGAAILDAARQAAARRRPRSPEELARYDLRSPCEGHVWTDEVAALLMGPTGGPRVMQLYNEWQHQLLLLRDALLPFANWRSLPLPVAAVDGGLRATEATRERLLGALLMGRPEHAALVAQAGALFGRAPAADSYGFQGASGAVLPAFLDNDDRFLLKYHPVLIEGAEGGTDFVYADADYYSAPRTVIAGGTDASPPVARAGTASLRAAPAGSGRAWLTLDLELDGRRHAIDVGRIFRGIRFAAGPQSAATDARAGEAVRWHAAHTLFGRDLVTAESGVIAVAADHVTTLALAGSIYPENIVIARGEPIADLRLRGKGYGPLFIIGDIA